MFAADVLGPPPLLRVSELSEVRRSDLAIEEARKGQRIILSIRRPKTDQAGVGAARASIETHMELCHVSVMGNFPKDCPSNDEPFFGTHLRVRIECGLKASAIANGVDPKAICPHSIGAGGAPPLYVSGVSIVLIQRFDRWECAAFLRYLRYDAVSLEPLSAQMAIPAGMLDLLKLTRRTNTHLRCTKLRAGGEYGRPAVWTSYEMGGKDGGPIYHAKSRLRRGGRERNRFRGRNGCRGVEKCAIAPPECAKWARFSR